MYVKRNIEARSRNNCCCGKAISITYWSVCAYAYVHIALLIQHAMRMRHIVTSFGFSRQICEKVSNIKFHQNPSIGSRVVSCGQTDMTKLIVAFRSFVNVTKKRQTEYH